ncbi:hypothetical protein BG004_007389 [Podila humilis]|nr:hypothetical protein BG004_007389 [Podila humilis]
MSANGMVITTPPISQTTTSNSPALQSQPNYTLVTSSNTAYNASDAINISPASLTKNNSNNNHNGSCTNDKSIISTFLHQGDNLHPRQHALPATRQQPATHGYVSRVGFDTLGCHDTAEYAFTLQAKTNGWKRTKKSRTFLVGADLNDYSAHALSWTMENMVEDGDEIVALRVVPVELRDSLSKTKIPSFQGQEAAARSEAAKIMSSIMERNSAKKISVVVECMVGNVKETIHHMTKLYQPDMLVVGTRGRSSVKGFLLGSVSRYCLHHSTVPVIVVRPERKLNKSRTKTKGIFRRLSSDASDEQGYHPVQSPIDLMNPSNTSNTSSSNNSPFINHPNLSIDNNKLSTTPGIALFPSATIAGGESISSRSSQGSGSRPTSSIFSSSAVSNNSSPLFTNSPPPPDGVLKMKKSLTTDGSTGYSSSSSSKSNRKSAGFLNLSLGGSSKDKDKDAGGSSSNGGIGSGFIKSKKRHSHGG